METINSLTYKSLKNKHLKVTETREYISENENAALGNFRKAIESALETYSNVHRGSGYNSKVTTHLFEQTRKIVLDFLGLQQAKYRVIFCSYQNAEMLKSQLSPNCFHELSSNDFGLSVGVRALVVERKALKKKLKFQAGGGTARLVSPGWVIWAKSPEKFEAGTPAIVNIIAFAKALQLSRKYGSEIFNLKHTNQKTVSEILYHDSLQKYWGEELLMELSNTLIGFNASVPTVKGEKPFINFDNAASTQTFYPIWETVWKSWFQPMQTRLEIIREVKSICSKALGAGLSDYDILFTSNTTEAINLVAESMANHASDESETVIVNSMLEHNSNELPWRMVPGFSLLRLNIDGNGLIDLQQLETLLQSYNEKEEFGKKRIKLVSVSGASNVLGICNDLQKISEIVHRYKALLLVDAAQLVAHRKIDMEAWGIDFLAFSAHKMYAPFGSGALVARKGLLRFDAERLKQIQFSGEENIGGIAAMGKAFGLLQRIGMHLINRKEQELTAYVLEKLKQIQGLTIYGITDSQTDIFPHKAGVIVFSLKGIMPDKAAGKLALQGAIGVRSGCHCSHILIKHLLKIPAPLERFQGLIVSLFPKLELPGVLRISFGLQNNKNEVDTFMQTLSELLRKPGSKIENRDDIISPEVVKQEINRQILQKSEQIYN